MKKTLDRCISDILVAISQEKTIDYLDRAEIAQQNALADKIRRNIRYVEDHYPESMCRLLCLTFDPNPEIVYSVGCYLMYLDSIKAEEKIELLTRIKNSAASVLSKSEADSFQFAVRDWERKLGIGKTQNRYTDLDWKLGDTFFHMLSSPASRDASIHGWYVLFRKVGENRDQSGHVHQLMYSTLCQPDQLPANEDELNSLGLLRTGEADSNGEYPYFVEITAYKETEALFDLTRIGCFPNTITPCYEDRTQYNRLTLIPSLGLPYAGYETAIISCYGKYGISKRSTQE